MKLVRVKIQTGLRYLHAAGIADATDPCCRAWLNGTSGCIPLLKPCRNVDNNYFWDGYHLTEAMYSVIAARCIEDKSVCIPLNLKELVNV